jgi:hypothetical protein
MKKFSWLIALFVVLAISMAFVACSNNPGDQTCGVCGNDPCTCNGGEVTYDVIFKLSDVLAELDLGIIEVDDLEEIPGIQAAGNPVFEVIENGSRALKITTNANWGQGIDLENEVFEFKIGDKITVTGSFITLGSDGSQSWAAPRIQLLTAIGGNDAAATHTTVGAFSFERILTPADITAINTTGTDNPAVIRVGARGIGSVFTITEFKIERPSDAAPTVPTADNFAVTGLTQVADEVVAVSITPKPGMTDGAITIWYEGTDGTTYERSQTIPQAEGKYSVTFDVAAADGFTAATGLVAGTLVVNNEEILPVLIPIGVRNTTAFTGNTGADFFYFPITFPSDFNLANYTHFSVDVKFFDTDGTTEVVSAGSGWHTTFKFVEEAVLNSSATVENDYTQLAQFFNFFQEARRVDINIRNPVEDGQSDITDSTVIGGGLIQNGHDDIKYIEIVSIEFTLQD